MQGQQAKELSTAFKATEKKPKHIIINTVVVIFPSATMKKIIAEAMNKYVLPPPYERNKQKRLTKYMLKIFMPKIERDNLKEKSSIIGK